MTRRLFLAAAGLLAVAAPALAGRRFYHYHYHYRRVRRRHRRVVIR